MAVSRPTTDEFVGWLKLNTPPSDATLAIYNECFDASIDDIESRVDSVFVIAGGYSLLEADENYPPRLRTAVLLMASRLSKRQTSPEGVAGMTDLGVVVRILARDPDVEHLITRYKRMDGFA